VAKRADVGSVCRRVQLLAMMMRSSSYAPIVPRRIRELRIRGVDYSVSEWGDPGAPAIFYLHGWGDTGTTFQFVVDALESDWHVIAPDWRGFGRSTVACASYWFPDYIADLNEILAVYSSAQAARLVGHSMGANVASLYAGTMPERVCALVNVEGFGLVDSNPDDAPRRFREWIEAEAEGQQFSEYSDPGSLAARIRKRNPFMSEEAALFVATEWAEEGADGIVRLRADPRHKLPNPILYRRAEAEACWRSTTAETLLVTGSNSRLAEQLGSNANVALPHARHVAIADAGHMLHFEAPAALARAVESFLLKTL